MFQKYSQKIRIGDKILDQYSKVYVIAEIGINHEGSISRCKKLIRLAKKSNVDAVKIQLSNPNLNYSKNINSYKLYKKSSLSFEDIKNIYKYAKKLKIEIFATVDESYLNLVIKLKQKIFKVSSSLNRNIFFIEKLSKYNLPILISSGMSNFNEINQISNFLKKNTNNNKIIFMHAVSSYPPDIKSLDLERIKKIKDRFNCIVGYSDHYPGPEASIVSMMYGAKIIEKHFTDNKKRKGFDHRISSTPKELKIIIKQIRSLEKFIFINKKNKKIYDSKKIISQKRDYILNQNLEKGQRLKKNQIESIRMGKVKSQLQIKDILRILNKKTKRKLKKSKILKVSDFK